MPDISRLTDHTGYWLRMVSNAVSSSFARKLDDVGVTVAEWVFLRALHDTGAVAPSKLAAEMGMTKGAISKLADRLVEKDLVARTGNPDDRRAHTLSLTVGGREKVPLLAALADENDAEFFGVLTSAEREALDRSLRILVEKCGIRDTPVS